MTLYDRLTVTDPQIDGQVDIPIYWVNLLLLLKMRKTKNKNDLKHEDNLKNKDNLREMWPKNVDDLKNVRNVNPLPHGGRFSLHWWILWQLFEKSSLDLGSVCLG